MAQSALTSPAHFAPFEVLAASYDQMFTESAIGRAQRRLVWEVMDRVFLSGQRILELNCGTGVDACHLAERDVSVLACDSSPKMVAIASERVAASGIENLVDIRVLPIERICQLEPEGPFDGALSNFAGLNCVEDLACVAHDLSRLIKPGGKVVLCVFGKFCVWEMFWYLARANPQKAFRRFHSSSLANLGEEAKVKIHYPSVRRLAGIFSNYFRLQGWRGIGIAVPPSYLENLATRFPQSLRAATRADSCLGPVPILRGFADHALVILERN